MSSRNEKDGIRFSWDDFPTNKLDSTRIAIPLGCLYTPLQTMSSSHSVLNYDPIQCTQCRGVLNPHVHVDFESASWLCPFCFQINRFDSHYAQNISPMQLPIEMIRKFGTVEYILQNSMLQSVFLFIIDTAIDEEEYNPLFDAIHVGINDLPRNSLVGLITFGADQVRVHELDFRHCSKAYVFNGRKKYSPHEVLTMLGIRSTDMSSYGASTGLSQGFQHFLVDVETAKATVEAVFRDVVQEPWSVAPEANEREMRCTGAALSIGLALHEATAPQNISTSIPQPGAVSFTTGRLMLFVGGPCTVGEGVVASGSLSVPVRAHWDSHPAPGEGCAARKAVNLFYRDLGSRAARLAVAVDVFVGSLFDVGALEMSPLAQATGGRLLLFEKFAAKEFADSMAIAFTRDVEGVGLQMGCQFAARVDVVTSRQLKVMGAVGPGMSLHVGGSTVSDNQIGLGGTCAWYLGALDPSSSFAFYFEPAVADDTYTPDEMKKQRLVQFLTLYRAAGSGRGQLRLRVTTAARECVSTIGEFPIPPPPSPQEEQQQLNGSLAAPSSPSRSAAHAGAGRVQGKGGMESGLAHMARCCDVEASVLLLARAAVFRLLQGEAVTSVLEWLDRILIRVVSKFSTYRIGSKDSFRLFEQFSMFPVYMFRLRNSQLLHSSNITPDAQCCFRSMFLRQSCAEAMLVLSPVMLTYSHFHPPQPIAIESAGSAGPETILLLDNFFHVYLVRGEAISALLKKGLQHDDEHGALRALLLAPKEYVKEHAKGRFPTPRVQQMERSSGSSSSFIMPPSLTASAPKIKGTVLPLQGNLGSFIQSLVLLAIES